MFQSRQKRRKYGNISEYFNEELGKIYILKPPLVLIVKAKPRSTFVQLRVTTQNETFWVRFEHSASFFPTSAHIGIMHTANRRCVLSFAGLEIMLCPTQSMVSSSTRSAISACRRQA